MAIVEVDRGCTLQDSRSFIGKTRIPSPLKPLWLPIFRTWIAGQSVTPEEIKSHFAKLPLKEVRVEFLTNTPAFAVHARKEA
jgi:hypothetical protein